MYGVWGRVDWFDGFRWNQLRAEIFTLENAKVICKTFGLPSDFIKVRSATKVAEDHGY